MAIGDIIQGEVGPDRYPLIGYPTVDPKEGASNALAAYLERIVFVTPAGDDGQTAQFRLNQVFSHWPAANEELPYPAASISEPAYIWDEHNLVPTMLEETCDCFGEDTVLWKTDEAVIEFQVDFWMNTEAARQAVRAALPRMFNPTEGRAGVMVEGDPNYFNRPVRFTYTEGEDIDTSDALYARERRFRATIRAEIDVVHLRGVKPLTINHSIETTDSI